MIIARAIHLRIRNVSESLAQNIETNFMFSAVFFSFFFENRAVYEIMLKNMVEPERPQMTIWRMRVHPGYLRLPSHSQCVLLIAFTSQQLFHERPLDITLHVHCLSFFIFLFSLCCIFFLFHRLFFLYFFQCFYALLVSGEKKILTVLPVLSSKDRKFFISDPQIMR